MTDEVYPLQASTILIVLQVKLLLLLWAFLFIAVLLAFVSSYLYFLRGYNLMIILKLGTKVAGETKEILWNHFYSQAQRDTFELKPNANDSQMPP